MSTEKRTPPEEGSVKASVFATLHDGELQLIYYACDRSYLPSGDLEV